MLGKILKSKEKRDTALLIVMAVITIAFLLYIFIPTSQGSAKKSGDTDKNSEQIQPPDENETTGEDSTPADKKEDGNEKQRLYDQLNVKIEAELSAVYMGILITNDPFENFWVESLKKVFDDFKDDTLNKFQKISFYDLNDIPALPFPAEYSDSLKLNLLLSLFLIKMKEERIVKNFETLPDNDLKKIINFDFYRLVNDEVQKDYQLMPVLFYYTVLMKRLHIYPEIDCFRSFKSRLEHIRDLTPAKYVTRMRELLRFSLSITGYRVQWIEHDPIDADDNRVYTNRTFKTFTFLRQRYLVFPDPDTPENNLWIKELCEADSGDIELSDLSIISEDPANPAEIEKIFYTPVSSRFVVLLKGYEPVRDDGYLNAIAVKQIGCFHKSVTCIDFARVKDTDSNTEGENDFKSKLEQFGTYLKQLSF